MTDVPNGFTGLTRDDDEFESAADASRRMHEAIASGREFSWSKPQPKEEEPAASNVVQGVFGKSGALSDDADDENAQNDGNGVGVFLASAMEPEAEDERAKTLEFNYEELEDMPETDKRWAWAEISLTAIRHNVAITRRYLDSRTRLMAVVKADAYGHGAVQASKAMLGAGAERLAVSTVQEGVELRKAGITAPIVVLDQPAATSIPLLLAYNITPSVSEPDFAIAYGEIADLHGMMAPYHLAVNTGMNRVGVSFRDAVEFLQAVSFHRALELEGVFTHFATADCAETLDLQVQARRFLETLDSISAAGFDPGLVHAANSAATYRFPDIHFNMVRCGLSLYGIHPCEATRDRVDLRPAMSVHARIIDTHIVPVSEGVSYGYQYRSPGSVKICTLPIGYGDGLRRCLSGNIDVIMDGRYYPQVGAICMDQCMFEVDLRNRRRLTLDPQIGEHVPIVGEQGAAAITIDELAEKARTVPDEITVGFGQRLARVYR